MPKGKRIGLRLSHNDWLRLSVEIERRRQRDGRRPTYTEILLRYIRRFPLPSGGGGKTSFRTSDGEWNWRFEEQRK